MDINELRKEIDSIDKEIVKLFEKRMKIVTGIAEYKLENNMEIFDKGREETLLEKVDIYLENKELSEYLRLFFENLMDLSKDYQKKKIKEKSPTFFFNNSKKLTIAYLGIPGSYSYEAMNNYFGENINQKNFNNFNSIFQAVENGEVDYGVIPFENSSTGAIKDNFDLIREKNLFIVGEYLLKVDHNLLGHKDANLEDIREVYSHPQPFEQSSYFLQDKNWSHFPQTSTAESAKLVASSNSVEKGAIGSKELSRLYNLKILIENINNSNSHYTRFIIVSKEKEIKENANKISIAFSTLHKAGELFGIIAEFAQRGINMLSIKSLPILEKPWEHYFYIDISGNINDSKIEEALNSIESKCNFFKMLGNYEAWEE